jgi:large subunit ribosomal protein L35Ae
MKARIVSYRRGRHTQKPNQVLIKIPGIDSRSKASLLIGKKVFFGKLVGKIVALHGGKGVVRARFKKGLPGQAIGKEVEIKQL